MKTQVIQLERHDDTTSVVDKINWSKANRVLLVWPRRGRVLTGMLDLLLIQRAAQNVGVQLACVSDDDDVLDHTQELGIPVFRSAKVAEKIPWRRIRRKKNFEPRPHQPANHFADMKARVSIKSAAWSKNKWVRWPAFTLGILAVMGLLIFLLPGATVKLSLAVDDQSVDLQVWANPDLQTINLSGGIPASISSTIVEATQSVRTTGSITLPDRSASGWVTFTNLTNQPVTIPSGTVVQNTREPIIQFRTRQSANVAAQPGAQVEVAVQAVEAGSQGNKRAGDIQAVVGALGTVVSVINNDALSGGSDISTAAASQADLDQLRDHMMDSLQVSALQEFEGAQNSQNRLLPQTLKMVKIQEETVEPAFGLPGDQIKMTLRVEYQIWSFKETDLEALARAALNATIDPEKKPLQGSLRVEKIDDPVYENEEVRWKVKASQLVQMGWDSSLLIKEIAGQTAASASRNLAKIPGLVAPPQITLTPAWWPVIPLLPARIEVEIR